MDLETDHNAYESLTPSSPTSESENENTPLLAPKDANLSAAHGRYTKLIAYLASLGFVVGVGIIDWVVEQDMRGIAQNEEDIIEWKSQLMGWLSAVLYRESR